MADIRPRIKQRPCRYRVKPLLDTQLVSLTAEAVRDTYLKSLLQRGVLDFSHPAVEGGDVGSDGIEIDEKMIAF